MQYDYSATHDSWLRQAMETKDKAKSLDGWRDRYEKKDPELKFDQFGFTPKLSDLDRLPSLSFMLRVPFKLRKPYLSKDDRPFHLLDNPVRKDKVFQTPMVAPTGWKGSLRAALWQLGHQKDDEQIIRLFGDAREDEKGQAGRLYFYPTFFDQIGLEVINPHDRKTGVGKNPILIECVPAHTKDTKGNPVSTKGELVILYVPFGKVEKIQIAKDLKLVAEGVKEMLTVYGFGAKISSGFGVAEDQLYRQGELAINHPDAPQISLRPQEPEYPESLRLFLENNPNEDFQLKPKEWRKLHNASQSQRESYQDARNARSTYQNALNVYESELARWEVQANTSPLPKTERNFNTLDQLVTKAKELEQQLIGDSSHD